MDIQVEKIESLVLNCQICDVTEKIPKHCGRPMNIVGDKLFCWKGEHKPCCKNESVMDIPYHHDKPMNNGL
jgi:hypothetical protein